MRNLAARNKVLRLSDMENYASGGSTTQEIRNWYDEATSLVNFLYTKYEPTALGKLVACLNDGMKIDEAIKETTGLTKVEFENEWRKWVGAPALTEADFRPVPVLKLPAFPANKRYNAKVAIEPTSAP